MKQTEAKELNNNSKLEKFIKICANDYTQIKVYT